MVLSVSQDLMTVAKKVVDELRSRHHPEKPHISVISPSKEFFRLVLEDVVCRRSLQIEEEEEDVIDDLEAAMTSVPPPWASGVSIEVGCTGGGTILVVYGLTIRRGLQHSSSLGSAPTGDLNEYTELKLGANVRVSKGLEVSGGLSLADGVQLCNCQLTSTGKPVWLLFFPKRLVDERRRQSLLQKLETAIRFLSTRLDPTVSFTDGVEFEICECEDGPLVARVHDRDLQEIGKYYHAVGFYVNYVNNRLNTYLVNLSGFVEPTTINKRGRSDIVRDSCEGKPIYTWTGEYDRWIVGYFMEVYGRLQFENGCAHRAKWTEDGLTGAYPLNTVISIGTNGSTIELQDYVIEEEVVKRPKRDNITIKQIFASEELLRTIDAERCEKANEILSALAEAVSEYINSEYLYVFQREALLEVLKSLQSNDKRSVIITAPTAAGKTLAFLLPIIVDFALHTCRQSERPKGVLYYLIYPTKALANDQLDEVANILYSIWKRLPDSLKNTITLDIIPTFGLIHGDVKDGDYETPISIPGSSSYARVVCGLNQYGLPSCSVECDECPHDFLEFLSRYFKPNRYAIYSDPPNILITDEDMINRILNLKPYSYSAGQRGERIAIYELHLFGGRYKRCRNCGYVYPPGYRGYRGKNLCRVCQSGELELRSAEPPRVIVLDEAHQLHGSFGSQVRYLFATLEGHVGGANNGRQVKYIVSSATIAQPEEFVSRLLNLERDAIRVISAKLSEKEEERVNRVHLVLMPRAYTRDNTLAAALYYLYSVWPEAKGIVFTNTIGENNDITNALRDRLSNLNVEIKSHSTDYNRYDQYDDEDRVRIEQWFKQRREKAVLVATPTMELGVDIGDVNFVALYGLPETLSSYIQRIGRAGRRRNALVLTVANPFNRYDYFFYENYKLLTDSRLRAEAQRREIIPISITNTEAWLRGVLRHVLYLFKYYCATNESCANQYVLDEYNISTVNEIVKNIAQNQIRDFPEIFRQEPFTKSLDEILRGIVSTSGATRETLGFDGVISHIAKGVGRKDVLQLLRNLRGFDLQIMISFPTGERRTRDAYFFTRKGLVGQIISFRGRYYVTRVSDGFMSRLDEFLSGRSIGGV